LKARLLDEKSIVEILAATEGTTFEDQAAAIRAWCERGER
jgi:hypothetical protein